MPISLTRGRHRDLERGETRRDGRKNKTVQESRQRGLGKQSSGCSCLFERGQLVVTTTWCGVIGLPGRWSDGERGFLEEEFWVRLF
jgi:hypothetical protein